MATSKQQRIVELVDENLILRTERIYCEDYVRSLEPLVGKEAVDRFMAGLAGVRKSFHDVGVAAPTE